MNCQRDLDAAASAASTAASAVCTYYVIIRVRFAPPYKYMVKYIQADTAEAAVEAAEAAASKSLLAIHSA